MSEGGLSGYSDIGTKRKVPPVHMIQAHSGTRGSAPLFLTSVLDAVKLELAPQG